MPNSHKPMSVGEALNGPSRPQELTHEQAVAMSDKELIQELRALGYHHYGYARSILWEAARRAEGTEPLHSPYV